MTQRTHTAARPVRTTRADQRARAQQGRRRLRWGIVGLLFEAGMEWLYDATIAVVADEGVRAERAAARGHEAVDERAARQLPQDEKAARATYVVHNDGTPADLQSALAVILQQLRR